MSDFAFGRAINSETQAAIERKQNILSNNIQELPPGISREFFSMRNTWVKLSSGVEIYNLALEEYYNVRSGYELAQKNVLSGLPVLGNAGIPDNTKLSGYLGGALNNSNSGIDGAISYNEYGFRPSPGITGVTVTSHGMYGALRTVTVSFKCWTPYQLDIMDVLYMRPGYTLLLEFGHSHYLDGDSKNPETYRIEQSMNSIDLYRQRYFDYDGNGFDNLSVDVANLKRERKGAYEGFVGIVKNYNWTFLPDGSYDCSVDLVSKGEIIESLAINVGTAYTGNEDKWSYLRSLFYGFNVKGDEGRSRAADDPTGNTGWFATEPQYADRTIGNFGKGVYSQVLPGKENSIKAQKYITLQLLNATINEFMLTTREVTNSNYNQEPPHYVKMDTEFEDTETDPVTSIEYHTSNIHISVDPLICLLPKPLAATRAFFPGYNFENRTEDPLQDNTIKDILLNVEFLMKAHDSCIDSRGNFEVMKFYTTVFRAVERATGNINHFELHCDENNTYYILDRKLLKNRGLEPDPIRLYGLGTVVKNLNLVSKLSPKISSLIAISAQADSSNLGMDATAFRKLNRGLSDGITPKKLAAGGGAQAYEVKEQTAEDGINDLLITPTTGYTSLIAQIAAVYNSNVATNSQADLQGPYTSFLQTALEAKKEPHSSFAIPFELTMTLDGTGGFTVGETFEIDGDILPLSYKRILETEITVTDGNGSEYTDTVRAISKDNRIGFIITGLEQRVSTTGWDTIIKAQIYLKVNKETREANFIAESSILQVTSEWLTHVRKVAWSASFIVFCARKLDAETGSNFPRPGAHAEYLTFLKKDEIRNNYIAQTYKGWKTQNVSYIRGNTEVLEIGDILINNRAGGEVLVTGKNQYSTVTTVNDSYSGATHGSIVVEIDKDNGKAYLISGNVSDTVKRHEVAINSDGSLATNVVPQQGQLSWVNKYFAIIRPSKIGTQQHDPARGTRLAAIAKAEFDRVAGRREDEPSVAPIITEYYNAAILAAQPPAWQP